MGKEINIQIQKAQRVSDKVNSRQNMPGHMLIKFTKLKYQDKILKATRKEQQITYEGISI